jgi:hypothetical protein
LDAKPFSFRSIQLGVDAMHWKAVAPKPTDGRFHGAAVGTIIGDELKDDGGLAWRFEPRDKGRPQ